VRLAEDRPWTRTTPRNSFVFPGSTPLTPKNEWDVVARAALVQSAGGFVSTLEKTELTANRRDPLLTGLLASGPFLKDQLLALVEPHIRVAEQAR